MPTLTGMRRRGYTPEAIRTFCANIGVSKTNGIVEFQLLEHYLREDLNSRALRAMAVLDPIRLVIDNYPEGQTEEFEASNNPEDESAGKRKIPFSKVVYIDRDDFREEPPKGFHRLSPGKEVRLRNAYFVKCNEVIKDASGEVVELRCTYDPESKGGHTADGRKVKGIIHWVSAAHAVEIEARLYESLLTDDATIPADPDLGFAVNPESLVIPKKAYIEPSAASAKPGTKFQFERVAYFCVDKDSTPEKPVFNRTVKLRDSWAKIEKAQKA
jgi:glutaminyl-tRNA synthetase